MIRGITANITTNELGIKINEIYPIEIESYSGECCENDNEVLKICLTETLRNKYLTETSRQGSY